MGRYRNDTDSEIILTTPVDLTGSELAVLQYWAKWEIENDYDYVQIMASNDNGTSWTPLCGKKPFNLKIMATYLSVVIALIGKVRS